MTAPVNFYADFQGLDALRIAAGKNDPKALREAARQFESIFTQMMLKSMRDASMGDSLMDNDQSKFYMEMFDNQIAMQLSKGRGLGLADMLVRQLTEAGKNVGGNGVTGAAKNIQQYLALPSRNANVGSATVTKGGAEGGTTDVHGVAPSAPNSSSSNPATTSDVKPAERLDNAISSKSVDTSSTTRQTLAQTPAEFIERMWPHAQAAADELGVDPRTLIAHAALETGWGKYVPCNPDGSCSFNLFGIKAGSRWQGDTVAVNTVEFEDGVAVRRHENFRAYNSPADSFRDYAALIKNNPRYVHALGAGDDAGKFATALQRGGYATDPNYAQKLTATAMGVISRAAALLKSVASQPLASGRSVIGGGRDS